MLFEIKSNLWLIVERSRWDDMSGVWIDCFQFNEIVTELEEQRELATTRLSELEKLQEDHQEALREVEKLKMDVSYFIMILFFLKILFKRWEIPFLNWFNFLSSIVFFVLLSSKQ